MTQLLGLIGYPLSHSFSKKYFTAKFVQEKIQGWQYELFPIENIEQLPALLKKHPNLVGLNVTAPYKQKVLKYLDEIHPSITQIEAVNCIQIQNGKLKGFNTDVIGFQVSMQSFLTKSMNVVDIPNLKALILGTGGAAKAVAYSLEQLNIPFQQVSRNAGLRYADLDENMILNHKLIVNTTPVGTFPNIENAPHLPYESLTNQHFLYDLVYNPIETMFMKKGKAQGASVENGLAMLHLQAEAAWDIWQM